jgi:hypothetical protein
MFMASLVRRRLKQTSFYFNKQGISKEKRTNDSDRAWLLLDRYALPLLSSPNDYFFKEKLFPVERITAKPWLAP